MPQNAIGKTGIGEIHPRSVLKCLRAIRSAHAVDLNHDKSDFRLRHHGGRDDEGFGNERSLWTCVNVFDDGIFLGGIKIRWTDDDSPYRRSAIAAGSRENLGSLPACL